MNKSYKQELINHLEVELQKDYLEIAELEIKKEHLEQLIVERKDILRILKNETPRN